MKRIEIEIVYPSKLHWEFAIIPNINFGYTNGVYFIGFGLFLWYILVIIKKK